MTLRATSMVGLLVAVHALDALTFWVAIAVHSVPIENEQNGLMAGAYRLGGIGLVLATELILVAAMVALLAKLTTRPVWPIFLLFYIFGLVGTIANIVAIQSYGGL